MVDVPTTPEEVTCSPLSGTTCLPHGPPCPIRSSGAVVNQMVSYREVLRAREWFGKTWGESSVLINAGLINLELSEIFSVGEVGPLEVGPCGVKPLLVWGRERAQVADAVIEACPALTKQRPRLHGEIFVDCAWRQAYTITVMVPCAH
jgi:hypothetical protein